MERCQLVKFIQPYILFKDYIHIFRSFSRITNSFALHFEVLLHCGFVTGKLVFICALSELATVGFIIKVEILGALIKSFEEIHDISETDIDFEIVHKPENLNCSNFALYTEGNFGPIHF